MMPCNVLSVGNSDERRNNENVKKQVKPTSDSAGIYHYIISRWNALPDNDSGVTASTLSIFNSCLRSIDISVFAVFNHFVLGNMLEVVF